MAPARVSRRVSRVCPVSIDTQDHTRRDRHTDRTAYGSCCVVCGACPFVGTVVFLLNKLLSQTKKKSPRKWQNLTPKADQKLIAVPFLINYGTPVRYGFVYRMCGIVNDNTTLV